MTCPICHIRGLYKKSQLLPDFRCYSQVRSNLRPSWKLQLNSSSKKISVVTLRFLPIWWWVWEVPLGRACAGCATTHIQASAWHSEVLLIPIVIWNLSNMACNSQSFWQCPNVIVRESQSLNFSQFRVIGKSWKHASQSIQGGVQLMHAVPFSVICLHSAIPTLSASWFNWHLFLNSFTSCVLFVEGRCAFFSRWVYAAKL